jgi:peptidoglycan hydrolase CwlO-like protein
METILVTVSVLSTLLVVGIVLAVVIVFNKFKGKVDVEKYKMYQYDNEKEIERIYNEISSIESDINKKSHEVERALWGEYELNSERTEREFDEIRRMIDSRTDKLYDKIHSLEGTIDGLNSKKKNKKQLLTD